MPNILKKEKRLRQHSELVFADLQMHFKKSAQLPFRLCHANFNALALRLADGPVRGVMHSIPQLIKAWPHIQAMPFRLLDDSEPLIRQRNVVMQATQIDRAAVRQQTVHENAQHAWSLTRGSQ